MGAEGAVGRSGLLDVAKRRPAGPERDAAAAEEQGAVVEEEHPREARRREQDRPSYPEPGETPAAAATLRPRPGLRHGGQCIAGFRQPGQRSVAGRRTASSVACRAACRGPLDQMAGSGFRPGPDPR